MVPGRQFNPFVSMLGGMNSRPSPWQSYQDRKFELVRMQTQSMLDNWSADQQHARDMQMKQFENDLGPSKSEKFQAKQQRKSQKASLKSQRMSQDHEVTMENIRNNQTLAVSVLNHTQTQLKNQAAHEQAVDMDNTKTANQMKIQRQKDNQERWLYKTVGKPLADYLQTQSQNPSAP